MSSSDESVKSIATAREDSHVDTRPRQAKRIPDMDDPSYSGRNGLGQRLPKVPPFSPDDPEIWFALLEGQFNILKITDDTIKFSTVISNIDIQHAKAVKDIIINPPPKCRYEKIKSELIRRLSASSEEKVKQLLTREQLGDRKPSEYLRVLRDLAASSNIPDGFLRTLWSDRLPKSTQTVLASQPTHSLEQLAELADRIHEITSPTNQVASTSQSAAPCQPSNEIAELKKMVEHLALKLDEHTRSSKHNDSRSRPSRGRSSSRSRTRSRSNYEKYPLCWYHAIHGDKAKTCIKPCDFAKAGNSTGKR